MRKILTVMLMTGLLSACAMAPIPADLKGVPVVPFGEQVPSDQDFILHFRAGEPISTRVNIHGDVFAQEASTVMKVKLKRDIYAYKQWMSYDLQQWVAANSELGLEMIVKVPGPEHPQAGLIDFHMFDKKVSE